MIGETSYYYQYDLLLRAVLAGSQRKYEAEYYHDYSHGLYEVMQWRHGKDWERYYDRRPCSTPPIR